MSAYQTLAQIQHEADTAKDDAQAKLRAAQRKDQKMRAEQVVMQDMESKGLNLMRQDGWFYYVETKKVPMTCNVNVAVTVFREWNSKIDEIRSRNPALQIKRGESQQQAMMRKNAEVQAFESYIKGRLMEVGQEKKTLHVSRKHPGSNRVVLNSLDELR